MKYKLLDDTDYPVFETEHKLVMKERIRELDSYQKEEYTLIISDGDGSHGFMYVLSPEDIDGITYE